MENAYDGLCEDTRSLPGQIEKLRVEGQEKTVRYKEPFAQKLVNAHIRIFLEKYGIADQ